MVKIAKLKIKKYPIYSGYRNPPTHIKVKYRKRSNKRLSPATFTTHQPNGLGKTSYATITLDPMLKQKNYSKFRKRVMKHEKDEIDAFEVGSPFPHAVARNKEK